MFFFPLFVDMCRATNKPPVDAGWIYILLMKKVESNMKLRHR